MPLDLDILTDAATFGDIVEQLHERGHDDEAIKLMSAEEAWKEWLEYEGIIGYADQLAQVLDSIRLADTEYRARQSFIRSCIEHALSCHGEYGLNLDGQTMAKAMLLEFDDLGIEGLK